MKTEIIHEARFDETALVRDLLARAVAALQDIREVSRSVSSVMLPGLVEDRVTRALKDMGLEVASHPTLTRVK